MPKTDDLQETAPADRPPSGGRIFEPADIAKLRERPALSEPQLIEHALRFANSGSYRSYVALEYSADEQRMADEPLPEFKGVEVERQAFRAALQAIVNREVIPPWLLALWERRAGSLLLLPTVQIRGGKRRVTYRHIVIEHFDTTPAPQFAYVLLLVLDTEKPYGRDLCQCRRCGKFFFVDRQQPNRPRTRYCSETHYQEAHAATAAERVRRSRENAKQRKAAKSQRRRTT